jgi:hypothetical protein
MKIILIWDFLQQKILFQVYLRKLIYLYFSSWIGFFLQLRYEN